jgi:hypothetical protein
MPYATPDVFVALSVAFTPDGGSSKTLTGITDVSTPESGNATTLESDANPFIQGVYIDGISSSPTVSTTDILQASDAAFAPGAMGELKITYQKRAQGKGAAATGPKREAKFDHAVVISRDPKANTTGKGDASITFQAYLNDETNAVCEWSTQA